jgi:hypothetical protein
MKTYGGVGVQFHILFTLALTGGEWSASCLGRIFPRKRAPQNQLDMRLGGPQSLSGQREELRPLDRLASIQSL